VVDNHHQVGNTVYVVQQTRAVTKRDASLSYIARTALVILKDTFHNISRIGITKGFFLCQWQVPLKMSDFPE